MFSPFRDIYVETQDESRLKKARSKWPASSKCNPGRVLSDSRLALSKFWCDLPCELIKRVESKKNVNVLFLSHGHEA